MKNLRANIHHSMIKQALADSGIPHGRFLNPLPRRPRTRERRAIRASRIHNGHRHYVGLPSASGVPGRAAVPP